MLPRTETDYCFKSQATRAGSWLGQAFRVSAEPRTAPSLTRLAAWNGTSWVALAVYTFALSAIVFRRTSPTEYGVWATIVALRAVLLLIDGGLAIGISRDAALEGVDPLYRARTTAAHRLYVGLAIAATIVGLLGAGIPGWPWRRRRNTPGRHVVTALFALETGATFLASPYAARLRGLQRPEWVALASVTQAVVGLVLALPLIGSLGRPGRQSQRSSPDWPTWLSCGSPNGGSGSRSRPAQRGWDSAWSGALWPRCGWSPQPDS